MGKRWKWAPVSLLSLTIAWLSQTVNSEVNFVPSFYDPKYHDDGRSSDKIVEYKPVESVSTYNIVNPSDSYAVEDHKASYANDYNKGDDGVSVTKAQTQYAYSDYYANERERSRPLTEYPKVQSESGAGGSSGSGWSQDSPNSNSNIYDSVPLYHAHPPTQSQDYSRNPERDYGQGQVSTRSPDHPEIYKSEGVAIHTEGDQYDSYKALEKGRPAETITTVEPYPYPGYSSPPSSQRPYSSFGYSSEPPKGPYVEYGKPISSYYNEEGVGHSRPESRPYSTSGYSSEPPKRHHAEFVKPISSYYDEEKDGDSRPESPYSASGYSSPPPKTYPSEGTSKRPLSTFYTQKGQSKFPDFDDGVSMTHSGQSGRSPYGKPSATFSVSEADYNAYLSGKMPENYENPSDLYGPPSYSNYEYSQEDVGYSPYGSMDYSPESSQGPNGWSPGSSSYRKRPSSKGYGSYIRPIPQSEDYYSSHNDPYKNHNYGTPYDLRHKGEVFKGYRLPKPIVNYYETRGKGWAKEPPYEIPMQGYRYKYSTLYYPGTVHQDLAHEMENFHDPSLDCENRHRCAGGKPQHDLTSLVDITTRPKKRKPRLGNGLFKRLIRNIAGKRRPPYNSGRRPPCKGRRCRSKY